MEVLVGAAGGGHGGQSCNVFMPGEQSYRSCKQKIDGGELGVDPRGRQGNGGDIGSGESSRRTGDDSVPDVQNDGVLIGDATLNREVPAAHL